MALVLQMLTHSEQVSNAFQQRIMSKQPFSTVFEILKWKIRSDLELHFELYIYQAILKMQNRQTGTAEVEDWHKFQNQTRACEVYGRKIPLVLKPIQLWKSSECRSEVKHYGMYVKF